MLLPFTFGMNPTSALIMLAGIFYGAQYGGSTSAILINVPGETSAVVTCLDGHQMARQGKAGKALGIAALGSFFAGCVATLIIALISTPLAELALKFNSPEYFSLMILGLIAAVVLSSGSAMKSFIMVVLGVLTGLVGIDVSSGSSRLTFGRMELADGMDFVPLVVGLFGIGEVIANLETISDKAILKEKIKDLLPSWREIRECFPAILRGTVIGSALGILPGGGAALPPFAAYAIEKKISKHPERFGTGEIRGVASPESANNAGAQTSFIPMLTMGIPTNALMALMIGAMMIHGIQPGPMVIHKQPELFWGVVASMWIGNLMLLVINLPLVGIWVKLLAVPYRLMFPAILLFSCIGIYSVNSSPGDVFLTAVLALAGYALSKLDFETAPLLLGFVLGRLMEENLRRALVLSRGGLATFVQRPISAGLLVTAVLVVALAVLPAIRRRREEVFTE
jgi:putative tricarboxylic transport membrane protein